MNFPSGLRSKESKLGIFSKSEIEEEKIITENLSIAVHIYAFSDFPSEENRRKEGSAWEAVRASLSRALQIFHIETRKTAQLCLTRAKTKVALKLQNPRLWLITHHILRHWTRIMIYHTTKDILHTQQVLGYKKLENTLIYVNLGVAIFQAENDNFHVKTAKTAEEIAELFEVGFEYVCEKDGVMFLRKRK